MARKRKPKDWKAIRKDLGLSQQEFWGPLGITQSGSSRYESGRKIPMPTLLLLEAVYGSKRIDVYLVNAWRNGFKQER